MAGILLNRSRQAPAEETPAFGGIAERFRRAGDLDRAIALCRDGLKRFPDQLSARVTLGWALLDKGQYDEARVELERVIRKAPDNLAAIRGLAELHDRSEGAMPADDSWHPEDVASPAAPIAGAAPVTSAAPQDVPAVAVPPTSANPAAQGHPIAALSQDDPFAPIALSLPSSGASATPELLHTAQQAGRAAEEAAAGYDLLGGRLDKAAPIELEHPAAASMAAAGASDAADTQPIQLVDAASAAIEAGSTEFGVSLQDGPGTAIDLGVPESVAADDQPDLAAFGAAPAAFTVPTSTGELLDDPSVTFGESDGVDLDAAIRSLSVTTGPAIDFGSAVAGSSVEDTDPEVAAAAEALQAIAFDDVVAHASVEQQAAADASAAEEVLAQWTRTSADEPAIDLGSAVDDTVALALDAPAQDLSQAFSSQTVEVGETEGTTTEAAWLAPEAEVQDETVVAGAVDLQPPAQIWSDDLLASAAGPAGPGKAAAEVALPDPPQDWFLEPEPEPELDRAPIAVEASDFASLDFREVAEAPSVESSDVSLVLAPAEPEFVESGHPVDASLVAAAAETGGIEDATDVGEPVEAESLGPQFELVAPDPSALLGGEAERAEPDVEVQALTDTETADLFAMMSAEADVTADGLDIAGAVESSALLVAADEVAPANIGGEIARPTDDAPAEAVAEAEVVSEVLAEMLASDLPSASPSGTELDSELSVEPADAGPLRATALPFVRPVIEHATAAALSDVIGLPIHERPSPMGAVVELPARPARSQAQIAALERLLRKVESRRLQLQAESVA